MIECLINFASLEYITFLITNTIAQCCCNRSGQIWKEEISQWQIFPVTEVVIIDSPNYFE